jgi:hypothetical protein
VRGRTDSQLHSTGRTDGDRSGISWGIFTVQTARPRDVGALIFVVGLFVVLFVITLLVPPH